MLDNITLLTVIFYGSLLLPVSGVFYLTKVKSEKNEHLFLDFFSYAFVTAVFVLIAFRPVGDFGFTDTAMYIKWFNNSKYHDVLVTKDIGFGILIYLTSKIFTVRVFFLLCTLISFGFLYWISRIIAQRYWFLFFLGTMVSLYFWNHQVFTIRQGIASMIFLAALFQKKWTVQILLFILAVSFHKSFLLPLICYYIVACFQNTAVYAVLWLIFIPISYFFGNEIGKDISILLPEDILYYYSPLQNKGNFLNFRWDVVLYSGIFIILPYLYRCTDKTYKKVVNLYILINLLTILMIWSSGTYIHRFAYLSWFLSPVIAYYPLLHSKKTNIYVPFFRTLLIFYVLIISYIGLKLYRQDFKLVSGATAARSLN